MTYFPTGDPGARQQAASASNEAASAKREVTEMQHQIDKLKLVCAALWELVKEKTSLTEDDIVNRIALLDAKDGVADGRLTRAARPCVKCKRTVAPKLIKCMYCGTMQPVESVFEGI